jgi:glycosyltransferase involved in cell wall biosynthesis
VLSRADAVLAVSDHLNRRIIDLGVDASRVHTLRPAVDRDRFGPGNKREARERLGLPASPSVLLWVGRMVPVKGLTTLLDACATLAGERKPIVLCLVGDGPQRAMLAARAVALGIDHVVRFAGAVTARELTDWYRAADVTVCASVSEGTPNVLLESIACGTRFVASDVGGIRAIATPGVDLVVPAGDCAALASALRHAIDAPPPSTRRRVVPGSWDETAQAISAVLDDVVARARGQQYSRGIELARLGSVLDSVQSVACEPSVTANATNSAA